MWIDRILEAKQAQGLTPKMMSERTQNHLPERTIIRILNGETQAPRIDTIIELGLSVGLSAQELFADTNIVAATETLAEVKEELVEVQEQLDAAIETTEVVVAEKNIAAAEIDMLRAKAAAQETEIALLKEKLRHKEELLAVYNYFTKIMPSE